MVRTQEVYLSNHKHKTQGKRKYGATIILYPISNLNSQNLGSGPRKYIQTQDSGQTKIWSHDHTVSNLKSQFPKIRVRTQKVYLSKPKHELWKRKNIQSQISILKTKGQDLGSIFHHNTQCKRKILSPNNIVFNLKS